MIADSQLAATTPAGLGGAQVAFMNSGGIRADLLFAASGAEGDGNVTYEEAFTVQPFGNSLVTLTLTGAQIETMLEQQFCGINAAAPRVLQPSVGFAYTWNAAAVGAADCAAANAVDPAHDRHRRRAGRRGDHVPRDGEQLPRHRRRRVPRCSTRAPTASAGRSTSTPSRTT